MTDFRQTRALLLPLTLLIVGVLLFFLTHGSKIAGMTIAAGVISIPLCLLVALAGHITLDGAVLHARGFRTTDSRARLGHIVRLDHLVRINSVGWRFGGPLHFGPPIFRNYLYIEDSDGNRVLVWAWGWVRKRELFALLRQAIAQNNGRVDHLTMRRLGIKYNG